MEQNKDWRQMTEEERIAIQDEVAIRQLEDQHARLEDQRKRAQAAFKTADRIWSVADLIIFCNLVNHHARRLGCLDKLPTRVFDSREAFLEEASVVLMQHGLTQEEFDVIFKVNQRLNDGRLNKAVQTSDETKAQVETTSGGVEDTEKTIPDSADTTGCVD